MAEAGFETVITHVGHRMSSDVEMEGAGEDLVRTITTHYALTMVRVRRPADGYRRMTTMVRCGECGKELRCVCYSPDRTRWRRRRQIVIGWGLMLPALVAWSFTGWKFAQYGTAPIRPATGFFFLLVIMSGVALVWTGVELIRSERDLSVRLHGDRVHSHRDDGSSGEVFTRATPPVPY